MKDKDGIAERIEAIRREWGARLLILGHHYQRSSVIAHTDERGDSLELARKAAGRGEAERIVFCGVHFMAESAAALCGPEQTVYMPETAAGCPMADMADDAALARAWPMLAAAGGEAWLPVVYVNSTAALKALCGRLGGSTCTSSNAAEVFEWVLKQGKRVFFLPDEHLGRNTAHDLGLAGDAVALYDPAQPAGGLTSQQLERARVLVWKGYCIVHAAFTVARVQAARERWPEARIILHPESPRAAVALADAHGSTKQIIDTVRSAPDGSTVIVGTEWHLVERLAEEQQGRVTVKCLAPSVCANMAKTNPSNLLEVLEAWPEDRRVRLAPEVVADARVALERMLAL